jgi:hypothetical protein
MIYDLINHLEQRMNKIKRVSHLFRLVFQSWLWLLPIATFFVWFISASPQQAGFGFFRVIPATIDIMHPITWPTRLTGFAIDSIPLAISMAMCLTLMKLFQLYENGQLFVIDNARYMKRTGILLLLGQLINPFYQAAITAAMTWQNPAGQRVMAITLDGTNIATVVIASIIILISWIMLEGYKLKEQESLTI